MRNYEEKEPPKVITSDTDNATVIRPEEAPPRKRKKFQYFRAYNTGAWNGPKRENKEVVHSQDNIQRYDCIASSLSLTDYQKSRGREIFKRLDLTGHNIDEVIFGLCVLVANADVHDGTRHWPHPDSSTDDEFDKVAEDIGLGQNDQMSIIQKVRSRTTF